jgi:hypothetical protein
MRDGDLLETIYISISDIDRINELAADGWEISALLGNHQHYAVMAARVIRSKDIE